MSEPTQSEFGISAPAETEALFGRVAAILDQARGHVVRAVNINMAQAYWLIGREIVQEVQGGEARAAYGQNIVADLSRRLTQRYGKGFSSTNLKYFRLFYQAFPDRLAIRHPLGDESVTPENAGEAVDEVPGNVPVNGLAAKILTLVRA